MAEIPPVVHRQRPTHSVGGLEPSREARSCDQHHVPAGVSSAILVVVELASDKIHRDGTPSAIQHRESRSVKPAPFAYHRPETLAEALRLLAELAPQDGRILAGGQSLVPIMAFRLACPLHLIDI